VTAHELNEPRGTLAEASDAAAAATASAASSAHHLAPGTVVADRYRVAALLGEGGMGTVYLAEHVHMRKRVALKVLLPEFSRAPEIVARFEREAIAAGSIGHPNVAAATDFGRLHDGAFFLVLELIDGRQLRTLLDEGRIEPGRALRILRGIVAGVAAAHAKGIVHRDLKPENVMLVERDGDPDFVKVLDFGIAKLDAIEGGVVSGVNGVGAAAALTKVGMIIGTPDYMAPEQALGQAIDGRTDLYTVGVMMFELLTGERPFTGGAATVLRQHVVCDAPPLPEAVLASLDPRIGGIVARLLAKAPAARPASATELLVALDECMRAAPRELSLPSASQGAVVAAAIPSSETASAARLGARFGAMRSALTADGARALVSHLRASTRAQRAAIGFGAALVAAALLVLALSGSGRSSAPATVGPLPPPHAASVPTPGPPAPDPPRPAPTAEAAPEATAVSTATASPRTAPRGGAKPASSTPTRRTGPGGIYVPPPSQWFK
jgi:hypothetical protein